MQKIFFLLVLQISLFSTSAIRAQNVVDIDTSHLETIRLDPNYARGGRVSDVFQSINYIPLETTKNTVNELALSIRPLPFGQDYRGELVRSG